MTEKERAEKYGVLLYEKANLEKRLAQAKRDANSLATELRRVCDALEGKRTWASAPNGGLLINGSHGVESMSPCRVQSEDKVIEALAEIAALVSRYLWVRYCLGRRCPRRPLLGLIVDNGLASGAR